MNNIEIWKDIPNYEGYYQVSNFGRVKSLSRQFLKRGKYPSISKEIILKPAINSVGYFQVNLTKNKIRKSKRIHLLVALAFKGHITDGTNKIVVDHIDNNPLNNNEWNIQIMSQRENMSKDRKNKTSKYTGVSFCKTQKKWVSSIYVNGKTKKLGVFDIEEKAHLAYQEAIKMLNIGDTSFLKSKKTNKYKGVSFDKNSNKWKSQIQINLKKKHLGLFVNEYEAHLAYQKAVEENKKINLD